jgi:hypothetical protein
MEAYLHSGSLNLSEREGIKYPQHIRLTNWTKGRYRESEYHCFLGMRSPGSSPSYAWQEGWAEVCTWITGPICSKGIAHPQQVCLGLIGRQGDARN